MYLDRYYAKLGSNPFFTLQTRLATEIFEFEGSQRLAAHRQLLVAQKGELWYRFTDRHNAPPGMDD